MKWIAALIFLGLTLTAAPSPGEPEVRRDATVRAVEQVMPCVVNVATEAGLQRGILVTAIDGQTPPDLTTAAKILHTKKKGERVQLEIAAQQRLGNLNMLRQGVVELATR